MKILNFLVILSFVVFNSSFAAASAKKSVAKGIPYCSKKITRGCVKANYGQTAKYYTPPKYGQKTAKHKLNVKPAKKKLTAKVKIKSKTHSKKVASNTDSKFHKNKQYKRNLASVLAKKLKAHKQKK